MLFSRFFHNSQVYSCAVPFSFFFKFFVRVPVVQLFNNTDTDTASRLILSKRVVFQMTINLSISIHVLPKRIFVYRSVDEILLLIHINWSTNFRGLAFNEKMSPLPLKPMKPMTFSPCSSRDST